MCSPENEEQIIACINGAKGSGLPLFVCGRLSNTIIKDGGFKGVMLRIGENYSGYTINEETVRVKAGTSMIALARDLTEKGFGGLEFAGGIPGTVGGGIRMNAGAYGGQMSDVVSSVTYYDGEKICTITDIGFGYRESIFEKMENAVILSAELKLLNGKGDMELLRDYNNRRREKQPLDKPNCGSVFRRPENNFASKLVDDCGLKGFSVGDAQVSEKHCGFIVNNGGATSSQVLNLMEMVRQEVHKKTGVMLENEWVIIGEDI